MHCLPIFLDSELNHFYYNGYCKSILSPMLHGCTMVYDDPETQFSWQKNTAEVITYQNAYRRVNNLFAQEILRYCQQLQVLDKETIIWINGYHLMLLPRDPPTLPRQFEAFVGLTVNTHLQRLDGATFPDAQPLHERLVGVVPRRFSLRRTTSPSHPFRRCRRRKQNDARRETPLHRTRSRSRCSVRDRPSSTIWTMTWTTSDCA